VVQGKKGTREEDSWELISVSRPQTRKTTCSD